MCRHRNPGMCRQGSHGMCRYGSSTFRLALGVILLMIYPITNVSCIDMIQKSTTRCLEDSNLLTTEVHLDCLQISDPYMAHTVRVYYGRARDLTDPEFCNHPETDPEKDCVLDQEMLTPDVADECATFSSCKVHIPYTDMEGCPSGYDGKKYIHVDYMCMSRVYGSHNQSVEYVPMESRKLVPAKGSAYLMLPLEGYWVDEEVYACRVNKPENLAIDWKLLDLRGYQSTRTEQCVYELILVSADGQQKVTVCTSQWLQTQQSLPDFTKHDAFYVIFRQRVSRSKGRLWMALWQNDLSDGLAEINIDCRSDVLQEIHSIQNPTTVSMTTSTDKRTSHSEMTSLTPLADNPDVTTTQITSIIPSKPNKEEENSTPLADNPDVTTTPITNIIPSKPNKEEENSFINLLPIIIGVVAGALLMLIFVLTCALICTQRKDNKNKRSSDHDVINAWGESSNESSTSSTEMKGLENKGYLGDSSHNQHRKQEEIYAEIPDYVAPTYGGTLPNPSSVTEEHTRYATYAAPRRGDKQTPSDRYAMLYPKPNKNRRVLDEQPEYSNVSVLHREVPRTSLFIGYGPDVDDDPYPPVPAKSSCTLVEDKDAIYGYQQTLPRYNHVSDC